MISIESFKYNSDGSSVLLNGKDDDYTYEIYAPIHSDYATVLKTDNDTGITEDPILLRGSFLFDLIRIKTDLALDVKVVDDKLSFNDWIQLTHGIYEDEISEHKLSYFADQYMVYIYELPSFLAGAIVREKMLHG